MNRCEWSMAHSIRHSTGWRRSGWMAAKWEPASRDSKREFKLYRLTQGKKQFVAGESIGKTRGPCGRGWILFPDLPLPTPLIYTKYLS